MGITPFKLEMCQICKKRFDCLLSNCAKERFSIVGSSESYKAIKSHTGMDEHTIPGVHFKMALKNTKYHCPNEQIGDSLPECMKRINLKSYPVIHDDEDEEFEYGVKTDIFNEAFNKGELWH